MAERGIGVRKKILPSGREKDYWAKLGSGIEAKGFT